MSNQPQKQPLSSATKQSFLAMGYTTESITLAYNKTSGDPNAMGDYLITHCQMNPEQAQIEMAKQSSLSTPAAAVGPLGLTKEEMDLQQAMEMSMKEQYSWQMFEPLSIQKRIRENGVPVGLRNIGNSKFLLSSACYVNSLLQAYFMIPEFVEAVLKFRAPPLPSDEEQIKILKENTDQAQRLNHILLISELQVLFANMIMSNKKYADPTKVLQLLSKNPQIGEIGDQKDAGEFNVAFLSLICEGFQAIAENQSPQSEENKEESKEQRLSSSGSKISLKKSVIDQAPRGISQTFFGELEEIVSFVENQKTQQNSNFVQFGQVMLDVDHKDLYEAWENSFYNQIDGYKPEDSDEPTRAIQELWIKQAPNVVLFQLQRVKYDLKAGSALKTNKQFKFPKEMFIDRYLKSNMETGRKIREKVEQLRKKAALLTQNLEMYSANKGQGPLSNVLFPAILGEAINLLKRQNENPGTPAHPFPGLQLQSPFSLSIPNQKLDEVQKVLLGMKETLEQQIASLESQLNNIKQDINIAYQTIQKTPFDLYGVLVHDGTSAEYGHYYAFIYDQEMNKWRKYNDMNVTEVTEEEVFAESEGGSSSAKSAYCLLYQKRKQAMKHPLPPSLSSSIMVRSFSIQSEDVKDEVGQESSTDYYNQLVPLNLAEQIKEENKKLALQLQQFKNKQVTDQIHEMFKLKLAKIKHLADKQKSKPSQFKMQLLSFPLFLHIEKQHQFFTKWVILNQIVQQVHPQNLGLRQLETVRGPFWDGLSSLKSAHPSEIPDLVMQAVDTLKDHCIEYYLKLQQSMYNMLTFKAIVEERWEDALRTGSKGSKLNQMAKEKKIKISKSLCKDSAKVLLLFLCSEVSKMLQDKNPSKLQQYANCLAFGIHFLPESDSHRKVIEEKMKKHLEKNSEFFGGDEAKNAYEALLLKGEGNSQDNDPFESWADLTEELKVWNPKCSPTYEEALQEWRDDWSEEELCISETKFKDEFLTQYKAFVDCHKKLSNEKWKPEDYYALEKELGIEQ